MDYQGFIPLHRASQNGHLETARLLLREGSPITAKTHVLVFSSSALQTSVTPPTYEDEKTVKDRSRFNINGQTSLHLASENGHKEMVQLLLRKALIFMFLTIGTILHYIEILRMDIHPLQKLCFTRAVTFTKLTNGVTHLHRSSQNGHTSTVELLLRNGANSHTANQSKSIPLHCAAKYGHIKTVQVLVVNGGSDIHAKDKWGHTPLHRAAQNGHTEFVECLIGLGRK